MSAESRVMTLVGSLATDRAGASLGRALQPGDVVLLDGALGAGKSALARAAILARLADIGRYEEAPSPSYTLMQCYEAQGVEIRHADLYRLSDPEEVDELGLLDEREGAILLVEWGERLGALRPERRLELKLELAQGGAARELTARGVGEGWDAALAALEEFEA